MAQVAYIRVSTVDQNTDRQLADTGVKFDKIFEDKASGGSTDRPALKACLEYLREGDTLHVHSIDRFARSLIDLQNMVADLTARKISIHFHKENLLFTTDETSPMNKLTLHILGAFAEYERTIIRECQREGIEKAKAAGVYKARHGGRKKTVDRAKVQQLRDQGVPFRKIADQLGCSLSSVQRCLAE